MQEKHLCVAGVGGMRCRRNACVCSLGEWLMTDNRWQMVEESFCGMVPLVPSGHPIAVLEPLNQNLGRLRPCLLPCKAKFGCNC